MNLSLWATLKVINSVGGLVWNDQCSIDEERTTSLCKFLLFLRDLLRHSLAVCILTVPHAIALNSELFSKISHLADYAFIFDDSCSSRAASGGHHQYEGLFRLVKLPRLNSLSACFTPETLDLAFHMKKKRLVVEQLHLPPDLGENDDAPKGRTGSSSLAAVSCSSSSSNSAGNSKLDF